MLVRDQPGQRVKHGEQVDNGLLHCPAKTDPIRGMKVRALRSPPGSMNIPFIDGTGLVLELEVSSARCHELRFLNQTTQYLESMLICSDCLPMLVSLFSLF
jgi:hypothetical protein